MKFAVVCLLAMAVIAYVGARPQGYTTKYDNIDIDQILNNDRLLKRYIDCLMDRTNGKGCPPEAIELRKYISEALETECSKCSERQINIITKAIKFLIKNKKDAWNELKGKYDPEGKYAKRYEDMAREEGIEV